MGLARQLEQQGTQRRQIMTLAYHFRSQGQNRVPAQDRVARTAPGHHDGFLFGQRSGDCDRIAALGDQIVHQRSLVEAGGSDGESNAGSAQQGLARGTGGGQDQPAHAFFSRLSVSRFITAAAVSSIERRETSICGQSCCSNSFLVAAISARTLSRSI